MLEVACGTGYWTRFIAQSAAHVVAIDTSPETMRIAEGRVPAGKVRFLVADAYDLPLDLGKFGAAFAGFWFSHVPRARRRAFLHGLRALLMPGAKIILLDNRYVEGSSSPITETDSDGNTYQLRRLMDGSTHRVLKNFPSEAELQSSLGRDRHRRYAVNLAILLGIRVCCDGALTRRSARDIAAVPG